MAPRLLVLLLATGIAAGATGERIEVGPLKLDVSISRTAALFHVVDQLSEWSYHTHPQYGRAFAPLSEADRAMLEQHKRVRAKRSWGRGLEQTFYTPLPLDDALRAGTTQGHLSAAEAAVEREVLLYFAPRIDRLIAAQADVLLAFRRQMSGALGAHEEAIARLARFTGHLPPPVPVYLLPNPDPRNLGGGFNGGRLTLEVPRNSDAVPTLLHELVHVFLSARKRDLEAAAARVTGLDHGTLNEGIAHAFSPGLVHAGPRDTDPLAAAVARDQAAGKNLADPRARANRYGLALRPLLRAALADPAQTLAGFLARAVEAWRSIQKEDTKSRGAAATSDELRTVTIVRLYRGDSDELPQFVQDLNARSERRPPDLFLACREWVSGGYPQMRTFANRASREFLLLAPGHPELRARLSGLTVSRGDGSFQAYGLNVVPDDRAKIAAGAGYRVEPMNTHDSYRWQVSENVTPIVIQQ